MPSYTLEVAKQFEEKKDFVSAVRAYQWIIDNYNSLSSVDIFALFVAPGASFSTALKIARFLQGRLHPVQEQIEELIKNLINSPELSAVDINDIAVMYHDGENGVRQNIAKARFLLVRAKEKGCPAAYRNLGRDYECGYPNKDMVAAARYYQQALERGHRTAKADLVRLFSDSSLTSRDLSAIGSMYHEGKEVKQDFNEARKWYEGPSGWNHSQAIHDLKRLERDRVVALVKDEKKKSSVDEKDNKNDTALHRAARDKRLKQCARLVFFGASNESRNAELKQPFDYLTYEERKKVERLQVNLSELVAQLETRFPVPILMSRMFVDCAKLERKSTEEALESLFKIEQIRPLMEVAKLAALGLHDLSRRPKFLQDGYDSDEDANEKLSVTGEELLTLRIDAKNENVGRICIRANEGDSDAYGLYFCGSSILFFGGARNRDMVRGTMIHELTHFVATEALGYNAKPYKEHDKANADLFTKIANDLRRRKSSLDPILQKAFGESYEENDQVHEELIVRCPQMIVLYPDGIERLQKQAPELLDYYNNVFLNAVKQHVRKLERRALNNWPIEVFSYPRKNEYSLQTR